MSDWEPDDLDLEEPAHIAFAKGQDGELHFGTVHGSIDYRTEWRDGESATEFSWEGSHDMDRASGLGWATRIGDQLEGRVFIHCGDDSAFTAVKRPASKRHAAGSRRRSRPK
jgi:hypothetical protein